MTCEKHDANWWAFSLRDDERGATIGTDAAAGTVAVNPAIDGKNLLTYRSYLGLDRFLASQVPATRVPDERIFIVTHQLLELVFKQMIFDFRVIADTFRFLLAQSEGEFAALIGAGRSADAASPATEFWLPASTAAARIRYGSRNVIPVIMAYLAREETFNNIEFGRRFRDSLIPASGLQSAQFRLIQRALGKSNLLGLRLFPANTYLKAYTGVSEAELMRAALASADAGLARVVDRLVLQEDELVATPPPDSELAAVAQIDNLAHEVLVRVAAAETAGPTVGETGAEELLLPGDNAALDAMQERFHMMLAEALRRMKISEGPAWTLLERRVRIFRDDWSLAVAAENERRKAYAPAGAGLRRLDRKENKPYLAAIIEELLDADHYLSGGFLAFHRNFVKARIGDIPGTAGGGILYLDFSRELSPLFPALAAARPGWEATSP